jgi:hypothetical protein
MSTNEEAHLANQSGEQEQPLLAQERQLHGYLRGHLPPYLHKHPKKNSSIPNARSTKRHCTKEPVKSRTKQDLRRLPRYVHTWLCSLPAEQPRLPRQQLLLRGDAITSMLRSAHHATRRRIPRPGSPLAPRAEDPGEQARQFRSPFLELRWRRVR